MDEFLKKYVDCFESLIVGMSEIYFANDGLFRVHVDHWDAGRQLYERLPVLGWLVKKIRSRIAA